MSQHTRFSFIIPALNEEKNIVRAIASIKTALGDNIYEIVVADNGSRDNTVARATELGATTIVEKHASIGGLRNLGVESSHGEILIFIDADVALGDNWLNEVSGVLEPLTDDQLYITGSTCSVPNEASFVQRHWFSRLKDTKASYINSGHMIMSRKTFMALEGFDQTLKTAEDHDICTRARQRGISVFKAPKIVAFHHGYPETIRQFISREAWHGRQDFHDFSSFTQSKTALLAVANIAALAIGAGGLLLQGPSTLPVLALLASIALSLVFTIFKFGKIPLQQLLPTIACSQLYLLGRALSPLMKMHRPSARA